MKHFLLCLSLITLSATSYSDLYRCKQNDGTLKYTDTPCPKAGSSYQPKINITQYKDIDNVNIKKTLKPPSQTNKSTCPYFTSTKLRNLRVKK